MKQDKLLDAIGELDEALLAESENTLVVQPKRALWRAITVAAIVAMLAVTAAGAGYALKSKPVGADLSQLRFKGYYGDVAVTEGYIGIDVDLEMEIRENLPIKLETIYAPKAPEEWTRNGVHALRQGDPAQMAELAETDINELRCLWIPDGYDWDQRVMYMQRPVSYNYIPGYSDNIKRKDAGLPQLVGVETLGPIAEDREVSDGKLMIAGIEAYVLTIGPDEDAQWPEGAVLFANPMPDGERRFYWTDGEYVFLLACPLRMTDAEIAALIETIRPVADVTELYE